MAGGNGRIVTRQGVGHVGWECAEGFEDSLRLCSVNEGHAAQELRTKRHALLDDRIRLGELPVDDQPELEFQGVGRNGFGIGGAEATKGRC